MQRNRRETEARDRGEGKEKKGEEKEVPRCSRVRVRAR